MDAIMQVDAENSRAGRREWWGLVVLALPTLLLSVDLSVLYLALPDLAADLQATGTQQLWILDTYGFMVAGFLVTMGTLGDRIGRRKLLMIGGVFFALASLLAAYSTSAEMLIASRAVLGIAGATLAPSTLALITNMFRDAKQRATAVAIWSACFMGGAVFGPMIGGVLLTNFWWGSVFLIAVPVMVLLLIFGPILLPEYRNPEAGRLDLLSVGLSLAAILPFIYGVKKLADDGWEVLPVVLMAVGIGLGALFINRQRHLKDPLLDLGLFKIRPLRTALALSLMVGTIQGGCLLLINLYLQLVHGLSPLRTGLLLGPPALGMLVTIMLSAGLAQKIRPAYLMAAGLVLSASGYVILSQVGSDGSLVWPLVGTALAMAGVGPAVSLGYNIILTSAPPEKAGSASAAVETNGQFGVAFGVALIGSLAVAVYRNDLIVPTGVPAEAAEAASQGIAGGVVTAAQLPAEIGSQLLASARDAFVSGLNVVAVVAAVLFVLLGVFTWFTLRDVEPMEGMPGSAPAPKSVAKDELAPAASPHETPATTVAAGDTRQ